MTSEENVCISFKEFIKDLDFFEKKGGGEFFKMKKIKNPSLAFVKLLRDKQYNFIISNTTLFQNLNTTL